MWRHPLPVSAGAAPEVMLLCFQNLITRMPCERQPTHVLRIELLQKTCSMMRKTFFGS